MRRAILNEVAWLVSAVSSWLVCRRRSGAERQRKGSAQRRGENTRRHLVGPSRLLPTACPTPLMSFTALLTFAKGGTTTGTTTNPAFAIGQRSPDHGVVPEPRGSHA